MKGENIVFKPIGIIHSHHKKLENMPIQPLAAEGVKGVIEVDYEYVEGLIDLDGFSHFVLIYDFHKAVGYKLTVTPFMDDKIHGVFATRSPKRPNAVGMSIVKLLSIEGNILNIEMVDVLDGTPLIDIKPFFLRFDNREDTKSGWLEISDDVSVDHLKSDDRYLL